MPYYSQLVFTFEKTKVNENKIKEVENFFRSDYDSFGFHGVKFSLKDGNLLDIELKEYYDNFSNDYLFAKKLSEAIKSGFVDLHFIGEDGYQWGYRVEKDKVTEMKFITIGVPDKIANKIDKYIHEKLAEEHTSESQA